MINKGTISCSQGKQVIEQYGAIPDSQLGGNAAHAQVGEWSCASPTAASSELQGVGTICARDDGESIRVVTANGSTLAEQVDASAYVRSDYTAYQFSAHDGRWQCMILTAPNVGGCSGTMPSDAPEMDNPYGPQRNRPNTVEVGPTGSGTFDAAADARYWAYNGGEPVIAKGLPQGQSISVYALTCTTTAEGLACENRTTGHGFEVADSRHRLR